jgi:transcriptional regulator with XRE-family HTH domain
MLRSPVVGHLRLRGPLFIEGTAARRQPTEDCELAIASVPQTSAGCELVEGAAEAKSTGAAVMELRRLSGLTWDQLAGLFGVARRSLHFWASGKPLNAPNEERLRRMLSVIRKADRGSAATNRAMLLEDRDGVVPLDLLARGKLDVFLELVGVGPGRREMKLPPLSLEAQEARRPPPPEELVGALQDRVHHEVGKARPARTVRLK